MVYKLVYMYKITSGKIKSADNVQREKKHGTRKFAGLQLFRLVPACSGWKVSRRAIWSSVTQLSMEPHFGATLQWRAVSKQKKGPIWLPFYKECYFGATPYKGTVLVQDQLHFVFQVLMKMRITSWTLWDIAKF